jgi:Bacterial SH3 domain
MRFLLSILLFPLACAAEPATVVRATELKKQPASDAASVATLSENTPVDAGERQGGWTRVKAQEGEGWVKMLSLRYGASGAAKQGDTGITQLFNAARTGSSGTQVTTGVRGLDADMIKAAQPNPGELKKLEGFSSTSASAAGFAKNGKLQAQNLDYPAP